MGRWPPCARRQMISERPTSSSSASWKRPSSTAKPALAPPVPIELPNKPRLSCPSSPRGPKLDLSGPEFWLSRKPALRYASPDLHIHVYCMYTSLACHATHAKGQSQQPDCHQPVNQLALNPEP